MTSHDTSTESGTKSSGDSHDNSAGISGPVRFDPEADTVIGLRRNFEVRALQTLTDGFRGSGEVEPLEADDGLWGARTFATGPDGVRRQSILVRPHAMSHLSRYLETTREPFVTTPSPTFEAILTRHEIEYVVVGRHTEWVEYRTAEARLGTFYAKRSGLSHMNHIDEGLAVLRDLGATEAAQRAFCLHPLLQADAELAANFQDAPTFTDDPHVLMLALEYRHIANAYLSHRRVTRDDEVALSPLTEVNDMLRADKVQNAKDFLRHHRDSHPRRDALAHYFRTWLRRLGVTDADFSRWFERLQVTPTRAPCPAW